MMNNYYWSMDSWGNGYPPVNADEIIEAANSQIDQHKAENPDESEYELHDYSNDLWDEFCRTGRVGEIEAVYEEE